MAANTAVAPVGIPSTVPNQAGLVLGTLIILAAVANLPLAMANAALPSIGVGPKPGARQPSQRQTRDW